MKKTYFTLEQAQQKIPLISQLMTDVMKLRKALEDLNTIEIEYDDETSEEINFMSMNKEFHKLSYQFYRKLELIERQGCLVKDIDIGLVDFLSIFQGREVLLCWRFGEPSIDYFHEIEEGYGGRKSIDEIEQEIDKEAGLKH